MYKLTNMIRLLKEVISVKSFFLTPITYGLTEGGIKRYKTFIQPV